MHQTPQQTQQSKRMEKSELMDCMTADATTTPVSAYTSFGHREATRRKG
jgi:hypothetical protein